MNTTYRSILYGQLCGHAHKGRAGAERCACRRLKERSRAVRLLMSDDYSAWVREVPAGDSSRTLSNVLG